MDILFVSPVKYDGLYQRHQGLAVQMVKRGHRVFFVNPFTSNGASISVNKQSGLTIISGALPFKSSRYPRLQKYSVCLALFLLIKKLHLITKNTVLWLAEPAYAELTNFKWAKIIYDCCDLHGAFPGQNKEIWKCYEDMILSNADKLVVSHPYLRERLDEKNVKKCVLLPNATSLKSIERNCKNYDSSKIRLISSGAHYEWIDIEWLKMLASHERVELNIAGTGRGSAFEELLKMKNVIYHGKLNQDKLLDLMLHCDVGLVPFKDIELIKAVDPIKVYDYAACGLKIWAPDISALYCNKYITSFIKNTDDIEKAILKAFSQSQKPTGLIVPTWDHRAKSIMNEAFGL